MGLCVFAPPWRGRSWAPHPLPTPLLQAIGGRFLPSGPISACRAPAQGPALSQPGEDGATQGSQPTRGPVLFGGGQGTSQGTCSWLATPALPSPRTPAKGGRGRVWVLVGAGGAQCWGLSEGPPHVSPCWGQLDSCLLKPLSGAGAAGSDPVAHSHSLFYPNTAPRAGKASPPAKGSGNGEDGFTVRVELRGLCRQLEGLCWGRGTPGTLA